LRNALIAALSTIIVPGGAVVLVPYLILQATGASSVPQLGPTQIGSLILALVGVSMVVWVSIAFVAQGKGTPAPIEPPKHFVATGLYRFLRNPMYFGALLTVFAEALFFRSGWLLLYGAILWLALHIPTVLFEEPQLERRFGESYRQYKARTPRWIPRCPRS
jgi:protein-S-isoprenylcysteine O-methyltransferase Ste14